MNRLRTVDECKYFDEGCPRSDRPDEFCSGDGKPTIEIKKKGLSGTIDCEKRICGILEAIIYKVSIFEVKTEDIFTLKNITTVDNQVIEVLSLKQMPGELIYEGPFQSKLQAVVDYDGWIYLPTNDDPNTYHPNRMIKRDLKLVRKYMDDLKK